MKGALRMKIFVLTSILTFLAAYVSYAGNNTIITNYPAPSGSYNKVSLQNLQGPLPDCKDPKNTGMLFMSANDVSGTLEMCVNGSTKAVPYPEACFNQFCNPGDPSGCPKDCPTGFEQASAFIDNIPSIVPVTVTVCCSKQSTVDNFDQQF